MFLQLCPSGTNCAAALAGSSNKLQYVLREDMELGHKKTYTYNILIARLEVDENSNSTNLIF